MAAIPNPKPVIQPLYESPTFQFNQDQFQLFFSLVNFHLPAYDLGQTQQYSPALETVGIAFEGAQQPQNVMQDHIIRKFLIDCHSQLLKLTSDPVVFKLAMLHNELFLASEFLRLHQSPLVNYCDMLMAETYDLYNSTFSKTVNKQFWEAGRPVEDVINELLKKEIEQFRMLNNETFVLLSQCTIRRALDKAGTQAGQKIMLWAKENEIPIEK
jgi:hypothetical protein